MLPGVAVGDHHGGDQEQAAQSVAVVTGWERRRPELTTLHRVVRENLLTLYAAVEEGDTGASLPAFVRKELEGYVACGLLSRGFARVLCQTPGCGESRLVAFSCGGRAFCPSCLGRRMAQTAANLALHVLPAVPLRQWVLTLPHELRRKVAYDGKLFSEVSRLFTDSILGWYRRRLADEGARNGRGGAVVVMQRASSDLRANPHLHGVFLDGLFVMGREAVPVFRALPRLSTTDTAEVLQIVRARVVRRLVRLGVLCADDDATVVDDGSAAEPVLSRLAAAAVAGLPPAGPEVRRGRLPILLRGKPGVTVSSPRCVEEQGFSLHANTCAGADDERGREALLQYVLRPPIANEHVQEGPEGLVRILLKRPFSDGTTCIDMDPLSLLCRLASMVPSPRIHTVRYSGVLTPGTQSTKRRVGVPMAGGAVVGATAGTRNTTVTSSLSISTRATTVWTTARRSSHDSASSPLRRRCAKSSTREMTSCSSRFSARTFSSAASSSCARAMRARTRSLRVVSSARSIAPASYASTRRCSVRS